MKYHYVFEQNEIDYRKQVCLNLDKKKSKKEIKKEIIETKEAYKKLYSTENIESNAVELERQNSHLNIIKIKLN